MNTTQVKEETVKQLQQITSDLRVRDVHGDRVLVAVVKARTDMDRAKEMGLAIPETAEKANQPPPSTGIIVKVGDQVVGFQPGEAVMFSPYAGSKVSELGVKDKYVILDTQAVLCTLEAVECDLSEVIKAA